MKRVIATAAVFFLLLAGPAWSATITVPTVADLANARVGDGDLVQTAGQVAEDDGGGMLYRYDADSAAVADGVLIVNGPGGVGRYLSQAAERPPLTAETIADDTTLQFEVLRTDASVVSRSLSLAELKQTGVQVVNIRQKGAVGDGVADDTAAISAAITAAPSGGVVWFPDGRYVMTGITVTKPLTIAGPGVIVIDVNDYGFIVDLSNWGAAQTITAIADYALGSGSRVPNGSQLTCATHGLEQGDVIKITADDTYGALGDDPVGEMGKVLKVIDADNFVLTHKLEDIAAGFSGAMAFRKVPTGLVRFDINVDFITGGQATARTSQDAVIEFLGGVNPDITLRVTKAYTRLVQLHSCYGGRVNVMAQDVDFPITVANAGSEFGYGVVVGGGTTGTRVSVTMSGGNHAFATRNFTHVGAYSTALDRMQESGMARDVTVHDSVSFGSVWAAFDTHHLARRIRFVNCNAVFPTNPDQTSSGFPVAFQDRGDDTQFINCHSTNAANAFQIDSGDTWSTHCVMDGCSDTGTTSRSIMYVSEAATSPEPVLEIHGHRSHASCMWMEIGDGRAIARDITIRSDTSFTQNPVQLDNGAWLSVHGFTHFAGASTLAPFKTATSATATLRVRDYHVEKESDTTPFGLLDSSTGSTLIADIDDATYESFLAEGLIRTASAGTVTLSSDSWRSGGRRIEFRSSAPVSGVHRVGDIAWNTAPSAGGTMGWVCVTAGNPGTWKTFGTIAP